MLQPITSLIGGGEDKVMDFSQPLSSTARPMLNGYENICEHVPRLMHTFRAGAAWAIITKSNSTV